MGRVLQQGQVDNISQPYALRDINRCGGQRGGGCQQSQQAIDIAEEPRSTLS